MKKDLKKFVVEISRGDVVLDVFTSFNLEEAVTFALQLHKACNLLHVVRVFDNNDVQVINFESYASEK